MGRRVLAAAMMACLLLRPVPLMAAGDQLPALGDSTGDDLSPAAERKLGEEIMRQAREAGDIMDDPETTEYLNNFGDILIQHAPPSPQPFEFFVVNDPTINAFALPGGFIGVHSALIIATQSESELASVMSHEMGHVIQRHIARQIGNAGRASLLALGAMLLGMLALSRSGNTPDAAEATIAMSQGLLIQSQLSFSRDAEREADRVGFQILQASDFDTSGMVSFFERLQSMTRVYEGNAPSWMRDHPLTSERIADIRNRIREGHYHQRPDSIEFELIRARLRVLQDTTVQGLRDVRASFEDQLKTGKYSSEAGIRYGLAVALQYQKDYQGAQAELTKVATLIGHREDIVDNLAVGIDLDLGKFDHAIVLATEARANYPESRMIARRYAETLERAKRYDDAIAYLQDQLTQYRKEAALYDLLAKSFEAKGEPMQEHEALAENYYLRGGILSAIEQLKIARKASNEDFYENSKIDARMRQLQAEWNDLQKSEKDAKRNSPGG
jgi:beta-barrel assembly-enhancing protease